MSHPMEGSKPSETEQLIRILDKQRSKLQKKMTTLDRLIEELKRKKK